LNLAAEAAETTYLNPLAIIALPLIGSLVLLFWGKRFGRKAGWLASGAVGAAFLWGLIVFFQLLAAEGGHGEENARAQVFHIFEWIGAGSLDVGFDLLVDQLSMIMVLVVTGVGTLIHLYSISYMAEDPRYHRFFAYLNLFAAAMLLLVLADNLVLMYVGWEGVGLCSYLLIGFWHEKDSASNAAKKAFIVNRVGDFSFLLGILLLGSVVGTIAVGEINEEAAALGGLATIASLLLFGGATGKSAQIPLYFWLPDAMEGPTPVSALIHAATMVTAGVYMIARFSPVFVAGTEVEVLGLSALQIVGWIGALTALWAALMACVEYDIKRVLAYSTISQLGYMFLAHGVLSFSAGIFHLVTHAFFKALMFLGAGAVMHGLLGETDMRKMGGLRKVMPITGTTFLIGWLAISGIFPFAGFFSKDAILAGAWAEGEYLLWSIGVVTAFLTAFYMSRMYFRVFEGKTVLPEGVHHPHDATREMSFALIPLAGLSVVGGFINLPGLLTLEHFLEPVMGPSHLPEGFTPWLLAAFALMIAAAGIAVGAYFFLSPQAEGRRRQWGVRLRAPIGVARNKFYVDEGIGRFIVLPAKRAAMFSADFIDKRVIDGAVNGSAYVVAKGSSLMRRLQTGYVRNYAATFLVGVVLIFTVLVLRVTA
jgi:NADH-quinone oxidoreductase subunit L